MVRVPRDLDSTLYHCPVADSFGSFIFDWLWVLSVPLQFLFNRWLFLLIAGWKVKNSLSKWQSPQLRIPATNHCFSEIWQDSCSQFWIFDRTLSCFVCSSLHLCLSSSVAQFQLVPLRPPSNFFIHSLSIPVLSETQLQKAFSPNAGAFSLGHSLPRNAYGMMRVSRNEWPVPQLTGVYGMVRVPRSWLYSASVKKYFVALHQENVLRTTEIFDVDDKRNAQRWQSDHELEIHKRINPDDWKIRCASTRKC